MIESLVQKHGKQLIKELIDTAIISKNLNSTQTRNLFLEHKVIKPSTKIIRAEYSHWEEESRMPNGSWGKTGDVTNRIYIRNGNGKQLFYISFKTSQLPQILEELK